LGLLGRGRIGDVRCAALARLSAGWLWSAFCIGAGLVGRLPGNPADCPFQIVDPPALQLELKALRLEQIIELSHGMDDRLRRQLGNLGRRPLLGKGGAGQQGGGEDTSCADTRQPQRSRFLHHTSPLPQTIDFVCAAVPTLSGGGTCSLRRSYFSMSRYRVTRETPRLRAAEVTFWACRSRQSRTRRASTSALALSSVAFSGSPSAMAGGCGGGAKRPQRVVAAGGGSSASRPRS